MESYAQARLLYRNLLRAASHNGALETHAVKRQAEAIVGLALPDLYRRDAGRLAVELPWSAEQVWAACRGKTDSRGQNNGQQRTACGGDWLLWDLLSESSRSALRQVRLAAEPAGQGHGWETSEEVDRIMREKPQERLAGVLAGKGA